MRKVIATLGLIVIMLLGVNYVYAQGPGFGPGLGPRIAPDFGSCFGPDFGPGHRGMHEFWGPRKDNPLTPEQKTKFKELFRKFREENAKLIGEMVTKRLELLSLWTDPKSDSKVILDKEKELRDLQNQMRDKVIQSMLKARESLTPEQIEKFNPGCGMGDCFGHGRIKGLGHRMFR